MPNPAVAGASTASGASSGSGGQNPFYIATNLYAEKNNQGLVTSQILGTSPIPGGGAINAGNYLRGLRLMVRTVTAGAGGTASADYPWNLFQFLDIVNVDGSEILYNMGGYAYYLAEKYFRPWTQNPATRYDALASTVNSPQFTLFLQPEIRFTAGVLANTDTRSQYRWDQTLNTASAVGGSYTTAPTISVTPYMDAWAQPDAQDLQGTPNQPVPPGINLQLKRRHQIFALNPANSDNILLSTLTGNAVRGSLLVVRDNNNARQDYLTDPIYWQLDNRSLGKLNPDIVRQWMEDFYAGYGDITSANRETGVYVFPRFMLPGELYGQGWLYTANSTKLQWESTTASGLGSNTGTVELITDEVYPVGPVDPTLVDI
jgi:hypothetical protein